MFDMDTEFVIAVVLVPTNMFWPVLVLLGDSFFVFFLPRRT